MMASLPTILLILAVISLAATGLAVLIAIRSQREAHSAIFPIVREEESSRAQRARISIFVWTAVTALFLGGWLATLQLVPADDNPAPAVSDANSQLEQEPEVALVSTNSRADSSPEIGEADTPIFDEPGESTSTALPIEANLEDTAQLPIALSTETPVPPTSTPTATATPTPALGALAPATTGPRTPAPSGARIGPIAFASNLTTDLEPVDTNDRFTDGVETIYAVFPYSGMRKGLDFTIVWYQNGQELAREESEWEWGEQASSYTFLRTRGEGLYKLELYVNDTVIASDLFEIR